jgi:hypothetical protein
MWLELRAESTTLNNLGVFEEWVWDLRWDLVAGLSPPLTAPLKVPHHQSTSGKNSRFQQSNKHFIFTQYDLAQFKVVIWM